MQVEKRINYGQKEIEGFIKLQVKGGTSKSSTTCGGTCFGSKGQYHEFCKRFNVKHKTNLGKLLPVVITLFKDKSFDFVVNLLLLQSKLLKAAN